jgi:hypothetical protein
MCAFKADCVLACAQVFTRLRIVPTAFRQTVATHCDTHIATLKPYSELYFGVGLGLLRRTPEFTLQSISKAEVAFLHYGMWPRS